MLWNLFNKPKSCNEITICVPTVKRSAFKIRPTNDVASVNCKTCTDVIEYYLQYINIQFKMVKRALKNALQ